jgi:hypothetical protein
MYNFHNQTCQLKTACKQPGRIANKPDIYVSFKFKKLHVFTINFIIGLEKSVLLPQILTPSGTSIEPPEAEFLIMCGFQFFGKIIKDQFEVFISTESDQKTKK